MFAKCTVKQGITMNSHFKFQLFGLQTLGTSLIIRKVLTKVQMRVNIFQKEIRNEFSILFPHIGMTDYVVFFAYMQ